MFDKIFALKIPASEVDSYIHNYTCSIYLPIIPGGLYHKFDFESHSYCLLEIKRQKENSKFVRWSSVFNMCLSLQTSKNMSPFIYIADIPCR